MPGGVKRHVAGVLCSDTIGRALAALQGDRTRYWGATLDVSSPRIQPGTRAALFWRLYESGEARLVRRHLRGDLNVIELGGSIGAIAALALQRMSANSRLISVEADPQLVLVLARNLALNAGTVDGRALHAAIDYSEDGPSTRYYAATNTAVGGIAPAADRGGPLPVARTTLQRLRTDFEIDDFALICDIEGAEAGLLAQGPRELDGCRQAIIEWHESHFGGVRYEPGDLDARMVELGFERTASHGPVAVYDRP